jgi:hypothetical protein
LPAPQLYRLSRRGPPPRVPFGDHPRSVGQPWPCGTSVRHAEDCAALRPRHRPFWPAGQVPGSGCASTWRPRCRPCRARYPHDRHRHAVMAYGRQETCSGILIGSAWAVSLDILVVCAWSGGGIAEAGAISCSRGKSHGTICGIRRWSTWCRMKHILTRHVGEVVGHGETRNRAVRHLNLRQSRGAGVCGRMRQRRTVISMGNVALALLAAAGITASIPMSRGDRADPADATQVELGKSGQA